MKPVVDRSATLCQALHQGSSASCRSIDNLARRCASETGHHRASRRIQDHLKTRLLSDWWRWPPSMDGNSPPIAFAVPNPMNQKYFHRLRPCNGKRTYARSLLIPSPDGVHLKLISARGYRRIAFPCAEIILSDIPHQIPSGAHKNS